MTLNRVLVRPAALTDAAAVASLSEELGYPTDHETMARRMEEMLAQPHQAIFVACFDRGDVVGWVQVDLLTHLTSPRTAVIAGMVVALEMRNLGIGSRLIAQAEHWAKQQRADKMLVRSRTTREQAHRFYERAGFGRVKVSAVFEKSI